MELTLTAHKKEPEYCLLSQDGNPVRNNQQQALVFCTFGGPLTHGTSSYATDCAHTGPEVEREGVQRTNLAPNIKINGAKQPSPPPHQKKNTSSWHCGY